MGTLNTNNIDITKPTTGMATTQSVRDNFSAIKSALDTVSSLSYANKAEAALNDPVNNALYLIGGTDGGQFKGVTGAAAGTYSDDGGSYCGTQFIPTGGDGSAAWVRDYSGAIDVKWFGVTGGGITDDATALQASIDYAKDNDKKLTGALGNTYLIMSGITMYSPMQIDLQGAIILTDTSFTTGTAITITGSGEAYKYFGRIAGFRLEGPYSKTRGYSVPPSPSNIALDGINIVGTTDQVSQIEFNFAVGGFRDNVILSDANVYIMSFLEIQNYSAWRRGWSFIATTNSGENISIRGGATFNCVDSTDTAVGIYTDSGINFDIIFAEHSVDYCSRSFDHNAGELTFSNCHLENNTQKPHGTVIRGGTAEATLRILGGYIVGGPLSQTYSTAEVTNGRDSIIVAGTSANVIVRDINLAIYGRYLTEFVTVTSGQTARNIDISGFGVSGNGANLSVSDVCKETTKTRNPDFPTDLTGWTKTAGAITWDGTIGHTTNGSIKFTTPVSGISATQNIPLSGLKYNLICTSWVYTAATIAASKIFGLRVQFYDINDVLIEDNFPSQAIGTGIDSTDSATTWIKIGAIYRIPRGATYVQVQIYGNDTGTTTYMDEVHTWEM